jgi:large subunit ribosomal protein L18
MRTSKRAAARDLRRERIRRHLKGTTERPRLSVFRSGKHIYAQVVSDTSGQTLLSVSTLSADLREKLPKTANVNAAKEVGLAAARKCLEKGIKRVIFDRNGFLYHGRIRAVAEGAREGGLEF